MKQPSQARWKLIKNMGSESKSKYGGFRQAVNQSQCDVALMAFREAFL